MYKKIIPCNLSVNTTSYLNLVSIFLNTQGDFRSVNLIVSNGTDSSKKESVYAIDKIETSNFEDRVLVTTDVIF